MKFRVDFRARGTAILPGQCAPVWDLREQWYAHENDDRLITHMAVSIYKQNALCIDPRFPLGIWGGISDAELRTQLDPITQMAELMYPGGIGTWGKGHRPCIPSEGSERPLTVSTWQKAEGHLQSPMWDPKDCPFWAVKHDFGEDFFCPTAGEVIKVRALNIPFVTTWQSICHTEVDFFPRYTELFMEEVGESTEVYFCRPGHVDSDVVGPGEASPEGVYGYPAFSNLNWPELSCDFFGDKFHRWLQRGVLDDVQSQTPQHAGSFSPVGGTWF